MRNFNSSLQIDIFDTLSRNNLNARHSLNPALILRHSTDFERKNGMKGATKFQAANTNHNL